MCIKCDKEEKITEHHFKAPDYKGDIVDWVTYQYYEKTPVEKPVGVTVNETTYTKTLEEGEKESIIYSNKRFHQINDDWHLVKYETIRKEEFDAEMALGK